MTILKICNKSLIPKTFKLQSKSIGNQQIICTWGIFSISAQGHQIEAALCGKCNVSREGEHPESACEGDHTSLLLGGKMPSLLCITQYLRTICHSEDVRVIFQHSTYKEVPFLTSGLLKCGVTL